MQKIFIGYVSVLLSLIASNTLLALELPATLLSQLQQHPSVTKFTLLSQANMRNSEGAMGLPNPNLELAINNLPVEDPAFDRFLPTSKSLMFAQSIPNQSKRRSAANKQVAEAQLNLLKAKDRLAEMRQAVLAKLTNLQKIAQLRTVLQKQQQHYDELEAWLQGKLDAGDNVYARFAELDVQRSDLALQQNDLDEEQSKLENELYYFFDTLPAYRPTMEPVQSWDGDVTQILPLQLLRQQIAVAQADLQRSDADMDVDYNLSLTYQQRDDGANFDGEDWVTFKVGFSLPLWQKTNQLPIKEAMQMRLASEQAQYDNQLRTVTRTLHNLYADIETLQQRKKLLKEQYKNLQQQLNALQRRYESGEIELEPLVKLQLAQLKIAMQQIRLQSKEITLASQIERYFSREAS